MGRASYDPSHQKHKETKLRRTLLRAALAALAAPALSALHVPAVAQAQPTPLPKPVRFVTAFPPGSGTDALLRTMAPKLQRRWGQPVIVDNRPGGNGFIAIDAFKRGGGDEINLLLLDGLQVVAYPHLFRKLPYDPAKDFEVLSPMLHAQFFVLVSAQSKYSSVGEILAAAKARPGKLNYGSWSVGNPVHLGTTELLARTGAQMEHIIYKDPNLMYTGVASGELDFAMGTLSAVRVLGGRIKPLAVMSDKRYPGAPDVPTLAESGGPSGLEVSGWAMIVGRKGLPPALTERLRADVEAVLADPDLKPIYLASGYDPFVATPAQFAAFLASESAKYADVVKKSGIRMD